MIFVFHHCAPSLPVGSSHARLMLWVSKPVIMQGWNQVEQTLYIELPGTSFCNWSSSLTHCQYLVLADSKTADCRGTVVTHSDASSSKVGRSKQKKSSLIPTWDLCQCFDWMLQSSSGQKWRTVQKCQHFIAVYYWGYMSLDITGGQRLVRIAPPFLSSCQCDPATRDLPSPLSQLMSRNVPQ